MGSELSFFPFMAHESITPSRSNLFKIQLSLILITSLKYVYEPLTFELKVKRYLMNEENKSEVLSFKV